MSSYKPGYEYLLAYKITVPIYDYTVIFCKKYHHLLSSNESPRLKPWYLLNTSLREDRLRRENIHPRLKAWYSVLYDRTHDQMIQAARSGTQNIPEGNQQVSLEGYIKLTGVNKGSLEELLKDYLAFARQNRLEIWEKVRVEREIRELDKIWEIVKKTPTLPDSPNFPDLPVDLTQTVNLMITLVNQAIYLQKRLEQSLEEKFIKEGGFRENLFKKRLEQKKLDNR